MTIRNANGSTRKIIRTAADGTFSFTELPLGRYTVSNAISGFEPQELSVTVGGAPIKRLRISLTVSGITTETVVTASRSEEDAVTQPVSASVVSLQDIQMRNVQLLDESLDSVPGLYAQRY